jgi:Family of unknown function (DUF6131)
MIVIGIVLLLLGFLLKVAILWTIGIIVLVVGLILLLLGSLGHAVGGRRHYWSRRTARRDEAAARPLTATPGHRPIRSPCRRLRPPTVGGRSRCLFSLP